MFLNDRNGQIMNTTRIDKNILMHTQERNVHGRAFGGIIMREIVELGWLCGYKYSNGRQAIIRQIFDVVFLSPVPIGSIVLITSRIVFVEGNIMICKIQLRTQSYGQGTLTDQLCTEVYMALEGDQTL